MLNIIPGIANSTTSVNLFNHCVPSVPLLLKKVSYKEVSEGESLLHSKYTMTSLPVKCFETRFSSKTGPVKLQYTIRSK